MGRYTFAHPNMKGTGSIAVFDLITDYDGDRHLNLMLSPQFENGGKSFKFTLTPDDITLMLQVFRGETESLYGDYTIADNCLLFKNADGLSTELRLSHVIDYKPGYMLTLSEYKGSASQSIFLSNQEALGLCIVLERALYELTLGGGDI